MKNIIILTNPRTGSNYIVDLFRKHGYQTKFGSEIFNLKNDKTVNFLEKNSKQLLNFIDKKNQIIKILYYQINQINLDFDNFLNTFKDSYFILLYRENILNQLISLELCKQDDLWMNNDHNIKIYYDFEKNRSQIIKHKKIFQFYKNKLKEHNIRFVKIKYDSEEAPNDFLEDDLKRVFNFCNIKFKSKESKIKKQRKKTIKEYVLNKDQISNFKYKFEI